MTDEPLQQKPSRQKRFILIGLAVAIVGIVLLIVNNTNRVVCDNSTYDNHNQRWQIEADNPSYIQDASQRLRLDSETVSKIERLAVMKVYWAAKSPNFLHFSPDSTMLTLSDLGPYDWMENMVFVWRLNQHETCILQAGDGAITTVWQHFVAFSSDSKQILLYQDAHCATPPDNSNYAIHCPSIWDINTNRLIDRYFAARLIKQNDQLRLEYKRKSDSPSEISSEVWQDSSQVYSEIDIAITDSRLRFINPQTKLFVWEIEASQNISTAEISPDGKLLALALGKETGSSSNLIEIELWGVKDFSQKPVS